MGGFLGISRSRARFARGLSRHRRPTRRSARVPVRLPAPAPRWGSPRQATSLRQRWEPAPDAARSTRRRRPPTPPRPRWPWAASCGSSRPRAAAPRRASRALPVQAPARAPCRTSSRPGRHWPAQPPARRAPASPRRRPCAGRGRPPRARAPRSSPCAGARRSRPARQLGLDNGETLGQRRRQLQGLALHRREALADLIDAGGQLIQPRLYGRDGLRAGDRVQRLERTRFAAPGAVLRGQAILRHLELPLEAGRRRLAFALHTPGERLLGADRFA